MLASARRSRALFLYGRDGVRIIFEYTTHHHHQTTIGMWCAGVCSYICSPCALNGIRKMCKNKHDSEKTTAPATTQQRTERKRKRNETKILIFSNYVRMALHSKVILNSSRQSALHLITFNSFCGMCFVSSVCRQTLSRNHLPAWKATVARHTVWRCACSAEIVDRTPYRLKLTELLQFICVQHLLLQYMHAHKPYSASFMVVSGRKVYGSFDI